MKVLRAVSAEFEVLVIYSAATLKACSRKNCCEGKLSCLFLEVIPLLCFHHQNADYYSWTSLEGPSEKGTVF